MLGMHYDLGPENPVDSLLPLRLTAQHLPARNLLTIAVLNASMCLSTWANGGGRASRDTGSAMARLATGNSHSDSKPNTPLPTMPGPVC